MYIHLLYPFLHQWTFTLLPFLGYCKQCSNEHWGTCIFWIMFFSRYVPMSGTARSYGRSVFSFLRNLHIVLRSGCTNLHSHKQCWKLLSWSHPLQHLFVDSLMIAILACDSHFLATILLRFQFFFSPSFNAQVSMIEFGCS